MQPKTEYARSGGLNIAYQVVGDGPVDLVFTFGWASHLDFQWTDPTLTRFLRRLAQFARVIVFDKRGCGLSDPVGHAPTVEDRMDDIRAVMDAVGSERAVLLGYSEGGVMAALYAAAHPERTAALVMYETWVCGLLDSEQNPGGERWLEVDRRLRAAIACWGDGLSLELVAPSLAASALDRRMYGAFERASMSPGMALALWESFIQADIRHVLPTIGVPTLIVHHTGSSIPVENARFAARHISGARFVEMEGIDHAPFTHDADRIADEIEEFLTGARGTREPDRLLATVMFTDIVGSTDRAAELGDRAWRELLERHNALVRGEFEHFGGREVKHTGDGFLATFDGPARAIRCAGAIRESLVEVGIDNRAGLHTGEVELVAEDVAGMAVHIAARVLGSAGPGEILVSSTVKELVVGSGITFEKRGSRVLKGAPGEWALFAVAGDSRQDRGLPVAELAPVRPNLNDRFARTLARRAPGVARSASRVLRR
jgi:pimeloyl-ACP methyl ester carboxylesterase